MNVALSEEEFLQKMDLAVKVEKSQKQRSHEVTNRMVPSEKKKLTSMLAGYIKAHNINRGDDLKKKLKTQDGSITLGVNKELKEQYSAIQMYPREKVAKMLKQREALRKENREAQ